MKAALVVSTYPDEDSVSSAAKAAVEMRLAACVSSSRISSVYAWKGKVERSDEYVALFKTTEEGRETLKRWIEETHPYDVPEIAEIEVRSINGPYLRWLKESTG